MNNQASPTQDQLNNIQLESIFMPEARRQRAAVYRSSANPTRFVHYTSADSALKIISSKRIWMRNTNCMTDYREVQHGFDSLNSFFANDQKRTAFMQALDDCSPGVAQEAITLFNGWLPDIRLNTFIASLSEHDDGEDFHGRLSMWRAFGGNVARVAIVLNIPAFSGGAEALNIMFSPIAYLSEAGVHAVIDEVIANIRNNRGFLQSLDRQIIINFIFQTFVAGVACLKHEGFKEEREWRAVYSPNRNASPFMESSTEVVSGVPQIIYKLPLDVAAAPVLSELDLASMFDRLIIGPSPYPAPMHAAFARALTAAGVQNAEGKIWASGIPIRS